MDNLESKFVGSLVGAGLGDMLGAGGQRYTDDTAMMIGIAESLIAYEGFDADHMAETFARNYEAEPWRGYGPGPPMIFRMMKSGVGWKEAAGQIYPGGSYGNGSAMRIAPIGLLYCENVDQLRDIAYQSSRITHTHPLGMEGAALQAYAVALAAKTEPDRWDKYDCLSKLDSFVQHDLYRERLKAMKMLLKGSVDKRRVISELGNTVEAFNSVPISIYSFLANSDFQTALDYGLSLGGDRDTISAMTGAIAGAYYGVEKIPKEWKDILENRDYIQGLAENLWKLRIRRTARE
jgi:poly(ADP-ribose) glycohydrolase ARH3